MRPEILRWVKIVVLKTVREKRLSHLDIDTLISAGHLGYAQSFKRFDPDRGVKFKTFAEYRIKGAVLDEVRKMIGDERCKTKRPKQVGDFDFTLVGDDFKSQRSIESRMDIERFFNAVPLNDQKKEILKCRVEGMNVREIAKKFALSETRASTVLSQIKKKIYPWFKEYLGTNFKLISYHCPKCNYLNETAEFSSGFDCDQCGSDVVIMDSQPYLKSENENG